MFKIAHVTSTVSRLGYGLSRVVLSLAQAQHELGYQVTICAAEDKFSGEDTNGSSLDIRFGRLIGPGKFGYSPEFQKILTEVNPDIIHVHGIWSYSSYAAFQVSRKHGTPVVISAHGMLDPWALKWKNIKKRLGGMLFQNQALYGAQCFHAVTSNEVSNIRNYGLKGPVALIPNGVDLTHIATERSKQFLENRFPQIKGMKIVLFLARIHPKKGLLNLITAWSQLSKEHPDWMLVVVGDDEIGYLTELRKEIDRLNLKSRILFESPVSKNDAWKCYLGADIFVLPSFSEGFSIAVLEAMSCGAALCISDACNFNEIEKEGCGIVCKPNVQSIHDSLDSLMKLDDLGRGEMGKQGRRLARERYSWESIGEKFIAVYDWLHNRKKPEPEWLMQGPQLYNDCGSSSTVHKKIIP